MTLRVRSKVRGLKNKKKPFVKKQSNDKKKSKHRSFLGSVEHREELTRDFDAFIECSRGVEGEAKLISYIHIFISNQSSNSSY